MLTLDDVATFTWAWGMTFFLETSKGNFYWKDPDYGGDNRIRPYNGDLNTFLAWNDVPFGRDKGSHTIREFCGDSVVIE